MTDSVAVKKTRYQMIAGMASKYFGALTLLPFTDREAVPALGSLRGIVDIIIPRAATW